MKKREEYRKREWQKPEYKSLKFTNTFGGTALAVDENTWFTTKTS